MKIIIAFVVLLILVYVYSAYHLQFDFAGWTIENGEPVVIINATNLSPFGFPVPMAQIAVYDNSGTYIGLVQGQELQWIYARAITPIRAVLSPTANTLDIVSLVLDSVANSGQNLQDLNFSGTIQTGMFNVPINFQQHIFDTP